MISFKGRHFQKVAGSGLGLDIAQDIASRLGYAGTGGWRRVERTA